MNKTPNLQVRLDPSAHEHLSQIIEALHKAGRAISMTRFTSDLILSQPIPNGNGHTPSANPCGGEENKS